MERTVLVLGGTGLFGQPLVRRLQAGGFHPRVLTRDPQRASALFPDVDVVSGDVTAPDTVRRALEGCWAAHLSVAGPAELPAAEAVAALAGELGLSRISYVSGSTVHEDNRWFPMVDEKLRAEAALARSGVPWTVFRPTWPFETLARFFVGGRATVIGKHKHPYHWFAADDFARMVAAAYDTPEAEGRTLYVHGPESLLMHDAAERYRAALHPDIERVSTLPVLLGRLIAFVTRNGMLKFACDLMAYFDRAPERGDPGEANRILGAPATTLDAWLALRAEGVAAGGAR